MANDRPMRRIVEIAAIGFSHRGRSLAVNMLPGGSRWADDSYSFRNDHTSLPNEFHACPDDVPRRLFRMAKLELADLLANSTAQRESEAEDALFATVTLRDGTKREYSWENPTMLELDGLFRFNEFLYNGDYASLRLFNRFYPSSGVDLENVRAAVRAGSLPLSAFYYDRVHGMFLDSFLETWPKLTVAPDGSVRITEVTDGREYGVKKVAIDPEGNVVEDGGLAYVRALKENGVRVVLDRENLREET